MSVIVLMYHDTPNGEPDDVWGVRFDAFRDQIETLIDAGAEFVTFGDVAARSEDAESRVCVTFDDGNGGNARAIEYLHDRGIIGSLFIVSDWSRGGVGFEGKRGYLQARDLRQLTAICALGGHGRTHRLLNTLPDDDLRNELADSRDYIAQLADAAPDSMSFPGGGFDSRVVSAARAAGFRHLGNSISSVNFKPAPTINRLAMRADHDRRQPLELFKRSRLRWRLVDELRRARQLLRGAAGSNKAAISRARASIE